MKLKPVLTRSLVSSLAAAVASCVLAPRESISAGLPIALLPVVIEGQNTNAAYWLYGVHAVLRDQLGGLRAIHVLPETSVAFGLRELKLDSGTVLTTEEATKLGGVLQARAVIWGGFREGKNKWNLHLSILQLPKQRSPKEIEISEPEWPQVIRAIKASILAEFKIASHGNKDEGLLCADTQSQSALGHFGKAYAAIATGAELSVAIVELREAVAADPKFMAARSALVQVLVLANKTEEALTVAREGISLNAECPSAHSALGTAYLGLSLWTLAREELEQASRLDPTEPAYPAKLAEIFFQQLHWKEAATTLTNALSLAPYDPDLHGRLGFALANLAEHAAAVRELQIAERYDSGLDPGLYQLLANSYEALRDFPQTVKYYQMFLTLCHRRGLDGPVVTEASSHLHEIQPRLTPKLLSAPFPPTVNPQQLRKAILARLTPTQMLLVTNPLESNEGIEVWARKATKDGLSPMEKGRRLFDALSGIRVPIGEGTRKTATEALKVLQTGTETFTCQDFAFLYVSAARSIGLTASVATVQIDYSGKPVSHACAAVRVGTNTVLVDPAYSWFGVAHRDFKIVDDVSAVAMYMTESHDSACEEAGLRLVPQWALPHFWVGVSRLYRGDTRGARQPIRDGLKLESASWMALYALGTLEMVEGSSTNAIQHLRSCLQANPEWSIAHFSLGTLLAREGALAEARNEYEAYLTSRDDPGLAPKAHEAIAYINATLDQKANSDDDPKRGSGKDTEN